MRKLIFLAVAAATLVSATPARRTAHSVDAVARDYVVLALAVQRLEPDWIDGQEAPADLRTRAEVEKLDGAAIVDRASALIGRLDRLRVPKDRLSAERRASLRANLISLRMQLQARAGRKWPVEREVELRYGFKPDFPPLSSYAPVLARLDRQMPGDGTLSERINRFREASVVPADKVPLVQAAALKECRRRAAANLRLPDGESVEIKWVDSPFSGNNSFKGNGHSVAELSRTTKWEVDQILWVTCHEIYPGHHLHFATLSADLFHRRAWPEFSLMQNYGPLIPVAEAVAEYGVGLSFPMDERIAFERDVLYPLAGLKMAPPDEWRAYWTARFDLLGSSAAIARDYLSGKLSKDQAREALVKYRMLNADRARTIIQFLDAEGSYLIASDLGWMTIDRRLRNRPRAEQWRAFQRVLEEPMTVADLQRL
jgi:hypothetical protein